MIPRRLRSLAEHCSARLGLSSERSEQGFVVVFCAILLTTMMGIAGMAVDLGNWYLQIQRSQRAADSAALAGAAFLPADPPTAHTVAVNQLNSENFHGSVVKIAPVAERPDLMGVRVQQKVKNTFFRLFGVKDPTFTRTAIAGFRLPLKLGSDSNVLGNETATLPRWGSSNVVGTQGYWIYTTANELKDAGDRWGSNVCPTDPNKATDFCTGATNDEYEPSRTYIVNVDEGATGHLVIQSYDGGFYPITECGSGKDAHADAAWAAYPGRPSYNPAEQDACSRDVDGSSGTMTTTMQVRDGKGRVMAGCPAVTYNPLPADPGQSWVPLLASTAPHSPGASYHNWDTICEFDIGGQHPTGTYQIVVTPNPTAKMYNAFSLRAAFVSGGIVDPVSSKHVQVYGEDRIVVTVHDRLKNVNLPIVQMTKATRGRTVTLEVFDMGDLAHQGEILPYFRLQPVGWNNLNSLQCRVSSVKDPPQWIQPCELTNILSATYSGHVLKFEIDIPDNATCNYADPTKCWIVAQTDYGDDYAALKSDTLGYSLVDNALPMRLYNNADFNF